MAARIYQKSKNALQSGKATAGTWILEFESAAPRLPDPLTGWAGGTDTQTQVRLTFASLDDARAYAERNKVDYHVVPATTSTLKLQSYADNFR